MPKRRYLFSSSTRSSDKRDEPPMTKMCAKSFLITSGRLTLLMLCITALSSATACELTGFSFFDVYRCFAFAFDPSLISLFVQTLVYARVRASPVSLLGLYLEEVLFIKNISIRPHFVGSKIVGMEEFCMK